MIPQQEDRRLEELVEALFKALAEKGPEIKTLVGHRFPDDDVWFCCWMAKKFMPKTANAEIVFVNAGTALPNSEDDPSVIHFDTGGGEFDQHNKERTRTSSATLLAEKLDLMRDPGLKALLAMVTAVDNVEPLPPTSIHYAIEGYSRMFKEADGAIDWQKVQERVFELFNIVYGQEAQRAQARENLQKHAVWTTLPNGLKVVSLLWNPNLREAAFEQGADVVLWTQTRWKKGFYVGVQRHRKLPQLSLRGVAMHLREEEAYLRQIQVDDRRDLNYLGREGPVSNWFLHQSLGLVLCGSRTWELTQEEYTKIYPSRLTELVKRPLSAIPRDQVEGWRNQQQHTT